MHNYNTKTTKFLATFSAILTLSTTGCIKLVKGEKNPYENREITISPTNILSPTITNIPTIEPTIVVTPTNEPSIVVTPTNEPTQIPEITKIPKPTVTPIIIKTKINYIDVSKYLINNNHNKVDKFIKSKNTNDFFTNGDFNISEKLENKFINLINSGKTNSFFAVSLDGEFSIGYNINKTIFGGCVFKSAYAMYVFKEIEKNNIDLNTLLTYEEKHYHGGSGNIQYSKFGTKYTIEDLIFRSIDISDNIPHKILIDIFPRSGFNKMMSNLECNTMQLYGTQYFTNISTKDAVTVWNEINKYAHESEYGEKLLSHLINAKFNYIKDVINIESAHKSGWTPKVKNDAGIVYLNGSSYIISIATNADNVFFNNSVKLIHESMIEYNNFKNLKPTIEPTIVITPTPIPTIEPIIEPTIEPEENLHVLCLKI